RRAGENVVSSEVRAGNREMVHRGGGGGGHHGVVGGCDGGERNQERALQGRGQEGVCFRPLVDSAALDSGYTAARLVDDGPIVFVDEYLDKVWRPANDTNACRGPRRRRGEVYKGRNRVASRRRQALGVDRTSD
ncbi:hypothetical protein B1218_35435, partial [Pseudomonas ogarae]